MREITLAASGIENKFFVVDSHYRLGVTGVGAPARQAVCMSLPVQSLPSYAIGRLLFLGERDSIRECVLMFADWLAGATITLGRALPMGLIRGWVWKW